MLMKLCNKTVCQSKRCYQSLCNQFDQHIDTFCWWVMLLYLSTGLTTLVFYWLIKHSLPSTAANTDLFYYLYAGTGGFLGGTLNSSIRLLRYDPVLELEVDLIDAEKAIRHKKNLASWYTLMPILSIPLTLGLVVFFRFDMPVLHGIEGIRSVSNLHGGEIFGPTFMLGLFSREILFSIQEFVMHLLKVPLEQPERPAARSPGSNKNSDNPPVLEIAPTSQPATLPVPAETSPAIQLLPPEPATTIMLEVPKSEENHSAITVTSTPIPAS